MSLFTVGVVSHAVGPAEEVMEKGLAAAKEQIVKPRRQMA
jgi:hypothetical protein